MNATGAVVFLPREGNGPSLMLEELLFDPAALWLAESLRAAGVERFFVVCHTDDQARAAACFPAGTEFVTGGSGDAVEQLSAFLNALEGKVIVITKPVLLDWGGCPDAGRPGERRRTRQQGHRRVPHRRRPAVPDSG